ncbi:hypothetical protein CcaverHIS002_0303660 [Cutaneotrichosporon cavernicola]|uniref:Uncharacterized protein n=1 Tax=Cutaneotrichosporon cavernicola TaxID=279322 RepID=A0AA48I302_9TREE|nr:uncharacterized protein CcaverHIS019_0303640 [Cutaneotrichosporon cavernicola]BEI82498.1 hypothetical protein CcaverHIS002_0303660 [Cutaneotrichosporon cavernicola]BEI90294.1 hypothetical protein CcaverHIS019_0303640 [Cutaneotrichosporon cavernicola]BEJ05847.1 hypothetical protein CcaverHIS641_0303690 [Cutaneotrichosporon cavernicola]
MLFAGILPLETLLAAAFLNCKKTCITALYVRSVTWDIGMENEPGDIGFDTLDPAHWPLDVFTHVAPTYLWALQRTYDARTHPAEFYMGLPNAERTKPHEMRCSKFSYYLNLARKQEHKNRITGSA